MAKIKIVGKLMSKPRIRPNVYRLKPPDVSQKALNAMARRFGMSGDTKTGTVCSDRDGLVHSEGPLELAMYRASGAIRFRDRARWQIDSPEADLKIEDAEAHRFARQFAARLDLPDIANARLLRASRLRVGEADIEAKEIFERTIDVAVALQRMVDNIPVDGPGGKTIVYLDQERQPTGLDRIWRDIDTVQERAAALRSPEEAIEEMASVWQAKNGTLEIEEVRFGYFEEDWRDRQTCLQPAYIIIGQMGAGKDVRRKTIYVTSALAKPVGRITPPLARKAPQEQRPDQGKPETEIKGS